MKIIAVLLVMITIESYGACVKVRTANIRSAPTSKGDLLWEAAINTPFQVVGKKGPWKKVKDLEGDIAWVHGKLLKYNKGFCAVVKVDKINLRKGPGSKYAKTKSPYDPKKTYAELYDTFAVLEFKGNWVKLKSETGSIHWAWKKSFWIQK